MLKANLNVLIWCEGLYNIKNVYTLDGWFYVQYGKGFARLKPDGLTSYKAMKWEQIEGEELLLRTQGIRLVTVPK